MGLKAVSLNLIKTVSKKPYIKPLMKEIPSAEFFAGKGDICIDNFERLLDKSEIFQRIKQLILKYAPVLKQDKFIKSYEEFAQNPDDIKVLEQIFNAVKSKYKGISDSELIRKYNKIFQNIKILRDNNPNDYELMKKGKFFKLLEEGKIDIYNLRTNMKNARLSESLLEDLRKIANGEEFIKDVSKWSKDELKTKLKNGEVYQRFGKLFTLNNGIETEIKLSKEKFEELFPPVLRHISNQGRIGNCWLVGRLDNLISTESGRSGLYSLFRQEGNNIFVKFPNSSREILFPNSAVLTSPNEKQMTTVPGIAMLEQALAVHLGGKYAKGKVTDITIFKNNVDRLMNNLAADKFYYKLKQTLLGNSKTEILDIISNEYTSTVSRSIPFNNYRSNNSISIWENLAYLFGIKSKPTKETNLRIMKSLINNQANNRNLKLNIDFEKNIPQEYRELYNIIPNHQLTLKSAEDGKLWISNPWFNWIEKGVEEKNFYRYLKSITVPETWI